MKRRLCLIALLLAPFSKPRAAEPLDGNAAIRGQAGTSEIVISTTARLADLALNIFTEEAFDILIRGLFSEKTRVPMVWRRGF